MRGTVSCGMISTARKALTLLAIGAFAPAAQAQFTWTQLADIPVPTTNHAFCTAQVGGAWYGYVFGGIGTGFSANEITLNAYRYDVASDGWSTLPDVPDSLGMIASAASVVGDTAYVIGGYHVLNGPPYEISSNRVHRLDLSTNTWLSGGSSVPVPVDDHVQAVWRDSLIYVVTGWSNTANVVNVQVYNPGTDQWAQATPVPNTNDFKAFGAGGTIIGDTIYYYGGAVSTGNFPAQDKLRFGVIDPLDPLSIAWQPVDICPSGARYRPGAINIDSSVAWIGGSATSYNFNAVAYNGSGVVAPATSIPIWSSGWENAGTAEVPIMDIRGIGALGNGQYLIAGGIGTQGEVQNGTWLIERSSSGIHSAATLILQGSPNPADLIFTLQLPAGTGAVRYSVRDLLGREVQHGSSTGDRIEYDTSALPDATYSVHLVTATGTMTSVFMVVH